MKKMFLLAFACWLHGVSFGAAAHTVVYQAALSGLSEAAPNDSKGLGLAAITMDLDLFTMDVEAVFSGLSGNVTAAHIHCCTALPELGLAGVATPTPSFPGFPFGVTSGNYSEHFDMLFASSYNAAFLNNAANAGSPSSAFNSLILAMDTGKAYFNIHSTAFASGEIRGFITPAPVPLPAGIWLLGSGLTGFLWLRRRAVA